MNYMVIVTQPNTTDNYNATKCNYFGCIINVLRKAIAVAFASGSAKRTLACAYYLIISSNFHHFLYCRVVGI